MKKSVAALVMAMSLYGCASTYGTPITQENLDRLVVGKTTIQEAVKMFGTPMGDTKNPDGTLVLGWGYSRAALGSPTVAKGLSIVFDKEGKVVRFNSADHVEYH